MSEANKRAVRQSSADEKLFSLIGEAEKLEVGELELDDRLLRKLGRRCRANGGDTIIDFPREYLLERDREAIVGRLTQIPTLISQTPAETIPGLIAKLEFLSQSLEGTDATLMASCIRDLRRLGREGAAPAGVSEAPCRRGASSGGGPRRVKPTS